MRLFYPMTLTTCVCFIRETLHIRNIQQYNRKIRKPFSHTSIDGTKNKINNGMNSGAKHTISRSVKTHACMSSPRYVCCVTSRRVLLMLVELNRECVEYTPVVYCSVATSARFVSMKWTNALCARPCAVLWTPVTWFSRKFITTEYYWETTLMVWIILKKNWKNSHESVC